MDTKAEKPAVEIISPEGVEERLIEEAHFRITLTGGGKYRTYVKTPAQKDWQPHTVAASLEAARKDLGRVMFMVGAVLVDAKRTIETLLDGLKDE